MPDLHTVVTVVTVAKTCYRLCSKNDFKVFNISIEESFVKGHFFLSSQR